MSRQSFQPPWAPCIELTVQRTARTAREVESYRIARLLCVCGTRRSCGDVCPKPRLQHLRDLVPLYSQCNSQRCRSAARARPCGVSVLHPLNCEIRSRRCTRRGLGLKHVTRAPGAAGAGQCPPGCGEAGCEIEKRGSAQLLGRAEDPKEFIRHGAAEGLTEITLSGGGQGHPVRVFHKIRRSGTPVSEWKLNGAPAFLTNRFSLGAAWSQGGCVTQPQLVCGAPASHRLCTSGGWCALLGYKRKRQWGAAALCAKGKQASRLVST